MLNAGNKKRMRHPLRNEWDKNAPAFERAAMAPGPEGALGRAMLAMVPPFLDLLEQERDAGTRGEELIDALTAVAGCIVENAIEHRMVMMSPRAALHRMLSSIERAVLPRVVAGGKQPRIVAPGQS